MVTFAEKQFCHFFGSEAALTDGTVVVTGCVVYLKTSHLLPLETSEGLLLKFRFDCIKEKGSVTFTTTFNVLRNLQAPFPRLLQRAISWVQDAAFWQAHACERGLQSHESARSVSYPGRGANDFGGFSQAKGRKQGCGNRSSALCL